MSFRKPCHMPFRKFIPPFTLPKTDGQINELCFITLWLRFDPSFRFQSYETETMNRNRMLLQTYHGHSASAASKKAFHGRGQYFSVSTLKFCVSFCVINFTFFKVLRGVQDLSRCMTSGNQKYFGKSRQVSLGLLALRNFPFAIISMHFPQLQTPHPLGGGGEGGRVLGGLV